MKESLVSLFPRLARHAPDDLLAFGGGVAPSSRSELGSCHSGRKYALARRDAGVVAVGTRVASRPPHGSVRAPLCIRLLPRVLDGKSLVRPGVKDTRFREAVVD